MKIQCLAVGAVFFCALPAVAFNPPEDTRGPITVKIGDPGAISALEKPFAVPVTVINSGSRPVDGTVSVQVIDHWRVAGPPVAPFHLDGQGSIVLPFTVIAGRGSYAALYPVHASVRFQVAGGLQTGAEAILILSVSRAALAGSTVPAAVPVLTLQKGGRMRLDRPGIYQPTFAVHGQPALTEPVGWHGNDPATGCSVDLTRVGREDLRTALAMHEPWMTGWGVVWLDYRLELPQQTPITLQMATAIRDSMAGEPLSDGVDFQVLVDSGEGFKKQFDRFSAARRWEPASIDLSAYAGRTITLRLLQDPGPAHDTTCDQAFWAEPVLAAGPAPAAETPALHGEREREAILLAKNVLHGTATSMAWKLSGEAGSYGAAIVPGPAGFPDCIIAFTDGLKTLTFSGFNMAIDNQDLGAEPTSVMPRHLTASFKDGQALLAGQAEVEGRLVSYQVRIWAEQGALRAAFSMPGVVRSDRGEPRFTRLGLGTSSQTARRVYAGFGNVIQDPGAFVLSAGGFSLSTRHVGADFLNGLSLVQASDIFPDFFQVDPAAKSYSLTAHHDATFTFVPSSHGAVSAAVVYRNIVNFTPAGGVGTLLGRMCLDQWGGDPIKNAEGIERAARFGLTDSIYVQHVWQHWGYDYRLPDIYPPANSLPDFTRMVDACKRNGILYCPHDNYIDFYPDARGYSYRNIVFNEDGTPQLAWYNEGRKAQSYRWLPTAFMPWLEENVKQAAAGFAPTAYFLDVFTAIPPFDFYDEQGRFYTKTVTIQRWDAAFDRIRQILGSHAPTLSEAGDDALIGHLDAGEADHSGWIPAGKPGDFCWNMSAGDAERIPWHDIASHGAFVLMGGGLGSRYAGGQNADLHSYGSDDYLCTTVMGGRSPMAEGPFSRKTVMTYWLLHDICSALSRLKLTSLTFSDDNIHRQVIAFSGGGEVITNRGAIPELAAGQVLPRWGFIARSGATQASVTERRGVVTGCSSSPGLIFADARPPTNVGPQVTVTGIDDLGNGHFHVRVRWIVGGPIPAGYVIFIHFVDQKSNRGDGIVFQGGCSLDAQAMTRAGEYPAVIDAALPSDVKLPATLALRVGLYSPTSAGARLPMGGQVDSVGRQRLGVVVFAGEPVSVTWQHESLDADAAEILSRLNEGGAMVDFGPVSTNGAFRLTYSGAVWKLVALPDSDSFRVQLHMAQLGPAGVRVAGVALLAEDGTPGEPIPFQQDDGRVEFTVPAGAFGCRINVER